MIYAIKTISTETRSGVDAVNEMVKRGWYIVSVNQQETMLEKVSMGK